MYKVVASDMDETFLDHRHQIPAPNLQALARMRELGVLFVPSSGRPYQSIMDNFADIDQSLMEDTYVISYNGAFINRYGDPEPLLTTSGDRASIERLYAWGVTHRQALHLYTTSGETYVQFLPPEEQEYLKGFPGCIELDDSVSSLDDFIGDDEPMKILFMDVDFKRCHRIGEELAPTLDPKKVAITYSSNRYVEFVPAGVDKGTGLVHLAGLLGIPVAETIGVGDAANDLEMIQAAGLGVGVANVSDDVRPYCDLVLETIGWDGAFPELVERVLEAR